MSWILDEQRRMLRDSAMSFVSERMPVAHLRQLRDSGAARGHSAELWRAFGEQGYAATLVPEAFGGLGLGLCDAGLIAEQIGHTLAPTPFFSTAVLAASLLSRGGSVAQQQAWLPRIAAAEVVLALAVDEGARHRPQVLATTARRDGSGWRIDGEKTFVIDGAAADALIVAAQAEGGVALLLVGAGTPGLTVEDGVLLDAHHAAQLRLDGVRVGDDALIGTIDGGRALLDGALDAGRVIAAAELVGLADEVFERTVEYLLQRKQFDRVIGEFQALQHRAAELYCDLELARALVRQAQQALDRGEPAAPLRVAQAKARAALSANRAVQEGVQMHGGIGMTDELDIGLCMKRARVLQELFGNAAFQIDRAAVLSGY
jgi:alkylation response protein AidB-like acyl-CoA dehydrogenase